MNVGSKIRDNDTTRNRGDERDYREEKCLWIDSMSYPDRGLLQGGVREWRPEVYCLG